jgi:hypothetical protein
MGHGKGLSGAEAVEGKRWQPIHADSPTPSSSHRVNAKGLVSGKISKNGPDLSIDQAILPKINTIPLVNSCCFVAEADRPPGVLLFSLQRVVGFY